MRIKPKSFDNLISDPTFLFRIGRLIGASEMSAQLLLNQEQPDIKYIGTNLSNAVAWFFDEGLMAQKEIDHQ